MRRVLIVCPNDWMVKRAGAAADYLHAVGARMAREGHVVVWLCANERKGVFLKEERPHFEVRDGIQVLRFGPRFLSGRLTRIVLSRLKESGKLGKLYDTIISCVEGQPLELGENIDTPVLPIVFSLSRKVRGTPEPPGPLVATCEEAHQALLAAGFPDEFIIKAPFGASLPGVDSLDTDSPDVADMQCGNNRQLSLVALSDTPAIVLRALELMDDALRPAYIELVGRTQPRRRTPDIIWYPHASRDERAEGYAKFTFGYCGEGYEYQALSMGGTRLPAVCPTTPAGHEYVTHEETGLLCRTGDAHSLAEALTRLAKDEVLRRRLAVNARKRAEAQTWDNTAALVLSAVQRL